MGDLDFLLPEGAQRALERYTRDLTDAALRDELEPVRCREVEIDRVIAILLRQSKNNPVLVGEAGVGKTAVAEGLAQRIVAGHVPAALSHARLLMMSHLDLIAGTTFRGQFEKRLQGVIDEASRDKEVILFIDELHNLIGAGSAMGHPLDAANMLKPALSRGELRVIGATTRNEYDLYIRADAALERRFHPVDVKELDPTQTLEVLQARRQRLESHHALAITDEALMMTVYCADKMTDYESRRRPDKAIDLIDEVCALSRMNEKRPQPPEVAALIAERDRLRKAEQDAMNALLSLATAKGNLLERFSISTYRAVEAMGLGLERLLTGQSSPRPPAPVPESIRRIEETNPAARLADAHRDRLLVDDRLRETLMAAGFVIDSAQVTAVARCASPPETERPAKPANEPDEEIVD